VLAGALVFGNKLAVANIWGALVTLGGIGWYNWIKIQKMREEENLLAIDGYEMVDTAGEGDERDGTRCFDEGAKPQVSGESATAHYIELG